MAERRRLTAVVEGEKFDLELNALGRAALADAGRRLSSAGARPGSHRSILKMRPNGSKTSVTVLNGVGVVATADEVVYVEPKIEPAHFRYIVSGGKPIFRQDDVPAELDRGLDWPALLARWYLDELRRVIEYGLPYDYGTRREQGGSLRGHIALAETLHMAAVGKPERIVFDVEVLDIDNATTRVLLHALRHARGYEAERADRFAAAFPNEVGPLRNGDLEAVPTIESPVTKRARALAAALISGAGIRHAAGNIPATAFLVPTPTLVEEGLRELLVRNGIHARKIDIPLPEEMGPLRLDLMLDGVVGDVKYKVFERGERWDRADMYQVVAFAAAKRFRLAFLIGFTASERDADIVRFGDIAVHRLLWNLSEPQPEIAGATFIEWVRSISSPVGVMS